MRSLNALLLSLLASLISRTAVAQDSGKDLGAVLKDKDNLSTFYELIQKHPDILLQLPSYDGVTIIAPSNDAFENIPFTVLDGVWDPEDEATTVALLRYHILQGTVSTGDLDEGPTHIYETLLSGEDNPRYANVTGGQNVLVNRQAGDVVILTSGLGTRCTLEEGDIAFRGGLVQVVDNLLVPPTSLSETGLSFGVSSFVGGLYAAELMPRVAERRDVTVFAPYDEALDLVGGTLEDFDAETLARIMGYHIVPDRILALANMTNGTRLETLSGSSSEGEDGDGDEDDGQFLTIRQAGNNKFVNSAQILQPDILLANGILHIISNVLNPDADGLVPDPEEPTQSALFPVSTAVDVFTSALPCTVDCPVTSTPSRTDATGTETETAATASEYDDDFPTSTSDGWAAPRCTGSYVGAALGALGVGAGLALL